VNEILKKTVEYIDFHAKKSGYSIEIHEVIDENSVIITHKEAKKLAILGLIVEDLELDVVAFLINIPKWQWAEDEGFTKEDLANPECLRDEVFIRTDIDELVKKMNFNPE
jgi:hypothetical protein